MLFTLVFTLLLILFFYSEQKKIKLPVKISISIALLIRLCILFLFIDSSSADIISFIRVGKIGLSRSADFPSIYLPFIFYLGAAAVFFQKILNPLLFLKIVFIIFDSAIVGVVYLLTRKKLPALLYALNPLTMIVLVIHGQMDSLPSFFFLFGVYLLSKNRNILALLSLSFAILTKTWPLLFAISFLKRTKHKLLFLLIFTFPALFIFFHSWYFGTSLTQIILPTKDYRGVYGVWGISNIFFLLKPFINKQIIELSFVSKAMASSFFLSIFVFFSFFYTHKKMLREIFFIMVFLFTFTLGFGAQWLTWFIPILIIEKPPKWKMWFFIATIYIAITFYADAYPLNMLQTWWRDTSVTAIGFILWGQIAWWLVIYAKRFHLSK